MPWETGWVAVGLLSQREEMALALALAQLSIFDMHDMTYVFAMIDSSETFHLRSLHFLPFTCL
jgi:hypothetical protein